MLSTVSTIFHFLLIGLVQTALVDLEGVLLLLSGHILRMPPHLAFTCRIAKWFAMWVCGTLRIMTKLIIEYMNRIFITLNALIIITLSSDFVLGRTRSHYRSVRILNHHALIEVKCHVHLILWLELLFLGVFESFFCAFRTNVSFYDFHSDRSAALSTTLLFLMLITFLMHFLLLSFIFAHSFH